MGKSLLSPRSDFEPSKFQNSRQPRQICRWTEVRPTLMLFAEQDRQVGINKLDRGGANGYAEGKGPLKVSSVGCGKSQPRHHWEIALFICLPSRHLRLDLTFLNVCAAARRQGRSYFRLQIGGKAAHSSVVHVRFPELRLLGKYLKFAHFYLTNKASSKLHGLIFYWRRKRGFEKIRNQSPVEKIQFYVFTRGGSSRSNRNEYATIPGRSQ